MTGRPIEKTPATRPADRFPEFPPRDDMQNSIYLDAPAHQAALSHHFGRHGYSIEEQGKPPDFVLSEDGSSQNRRMWIAVAKHLNIDDGE